MGYSHVPIVKFICGSEIFIPFLVAFSQNRILSKLQAIKFIRLS
jgi:hypothetical protein